MRCDAGRLWALQFRGEQGFEFTHPSFSGLFRSALGFFRLAFGLFCLAFGFFRLALRLTRFGVGRDQCQGVNC